MTNPSQWTRFWDQFEPMVNNVAEVCKQKEMEFLIFIGAALPEQVKINNHIEVDDFTFWNGIAERIWNSWAQHPNYRKYGYGDDRPMIIAFQPSDVYWERYWAAGLLDTVAHLQPETSGSAFFVYGMAYAINQGIIEKETFTPVVEKAYLALTGFIEENGKFYGIQPISDKPVN